MASTRISLIRGPEGEKGDDGDVGPAGPNTVPTQQAVADALTTPGSAAEVALSAKIETATAGKADAAAVYTKTAADAGFVARGTKRAAITFGTGGTYQTGTLSTGSIMGRYPCKIPVSTTRWRMKIANFDGRSNVAGATGQLVKEIWFGKHDMATTAPAGKWAGTPAKLLDAGAANQATANPIPADGTQWVSPWFTGAGDQFVANQDHLIALQTFAAAAVAIQRATVPSFIDFSTGQAGSTSLTPTKFNLSMFDIVIEFEYVDDGKVVQGVYPGDSITEGQGAQFRDGGWPSQHGQRARAIPANMGVSGDGTTSFTNGTFFRWTKFDWASYSLDYACVLLGTNDCRLDITLATYQANYKSIVDRVRSLGAKRVYAGLVPPQSGLPYEGTVTAASAVGATTIASSVSIPAGTKIAIGPDGAAQEVVTTSAVSGSGPYTLTVPALTLAHSVGHKVQDYRLTLKDQYNAWLKTMPLGIDGLIDFDTPLRDPAYARSIRPDMTVDNVHMTSFGYAVMAQQAPARP